MNSTQQQHSTTVQHQRGADIKFAAIDVAFTGLLDKVNQLKCSSWRRQGLVVRAEARWEKI